MTITPSATSVNGGSIVCFTVTGTTAATGIRVEIDGVNSGAFTQTVQANGEIQVCVRAPVGGDSITLFVADQKTQSSTVMIR